MRDHIAIGMNVRCRIGVLKLQEGDIGPVLNVDRDDLKDLNVEVWCNYLKILIKSYIGYRLS